MYKFTPNYNLRIPPKYKIDWYDDFVYFANQLDTIIKDIEIMPIKKIKVKRWNSFVEFKENAEINEIGIIDLSPTITILGIKTSNEDVVVLEETGLYIKDKKYIQFSNPSARLVLGWNIDPQEATELLNVWGNIKLFAPNSSIISKNNNIKFLLNNTQEVLELLADKIDFKNLDLENIQKIVKKKFPIENQYIIFDNDKMLIGYKDYPYKGILQLRPGSFLISGWSGEIHASNLKFSIPSKGANKVLVCIDDEGICEFRDVQFGDNLGNHTATQDLDLNNFNIKNVNKIVKEIIGDLSIETVNGNINLITYGHLKSVNIQNKIFTIGHLVNINSPVISLSSDNNKYILNAQNFLEIKHNIIKIDIPSKGENKVLTCIDNDGTCEFREISSVSSDVFYTFNVEQRGVAWGYGHFYKYDFSADNSLIRSTTSQYDQPQNLYMCPLVAPDNIKIVRITGCIYRCSVNSGNPQPPFTMRLRFQKNLANNRQQIGDVLITLQYANGWENPDNLVYQTFTVNCENLNLAINSGENFGVEFIGEEGNNKIIRIQGCYLQIIAKKI